MHPLPIYLCSSNVNGESALQFLHKRDNLHPPRLSNAPRLNLKFLSPRPDPISILEKQLPLTTPNCARYRAARNRNAVVMRTMKSNFGFGVKPYLRLLVPKFLYLAFKSPLPDQSEGQTHQRKSA